ncbi:MAG: alkaline phosphatase family protein [Bacteroidia bacterium]|nr:alkaline phosphatase family protein [Bacteroidia bacterium]
MNNSTHLAGQTAIQMKKYFLISVFPSLFLGACTKSDSSDSLPSDEIRSDCVQGASPVKKVLFLGIDGCRTDAMLAAHAPALDTLMAHSIVNFNTDRGPYTVSCPGWSTLLHGVWPNKHGVTSNDISNLNYGKYLDIFHYLRLHNPSYSLATISHWDNFLRLTTEEDYAQPVESDLEVKDKALELLQNCNPDVLLLHFDDVDETGHSSGFSPSNPEYIQAIQTVGGHIQQLMDAIHQRELTKGEQWMVVVVTDHGGNGTSHGDQDDLPETRYVFQIVRIPGIPHNELANARNVDILPSIFKYLEIQPDSTWEWDGLPLF